MKKQQLYALNKKELYIQKKISSQLADSKKKNRWAVNVSQRSIVYLLQNRKLSSTQPYRKWEVTSSSNASTTTVTHIHICYGMDQETEHYRTHHFRVVKTDLTNIHWRRLLQIIPWSINNIHIVHLIAYNIIVIIITNDHYSDCCKQKQLQWGENRPDHPGRIKVVKPTLCSQKKMIKKQLLDQDDSKAKSKIFKKCYPE